MGDIPLLVFANKQDLAEAEPLETIIEAFSLRSLADHEWQIQPCCAVTGNGITDGLKDFSEMVKRHRKNAKKKQRLS